MERFGIETISEWG